MQQYGYHKSTMNSGVCIKGSWWAKVESNHYGILKEVIKLTYLEGNNIILFKYQWFDTDDCMKIDPQHGLIEIIHISKAYVNNPFVLAQQAVQVYYTPFPSRKRGRKDSQAVCKVKSRAIHYELEKEKKESHLSEYFQKDEILVVHQHLIDVELDVPKIFLHDGQHEEVDHIEFIFKKHPIQEGEEEEEVEEEKEEESEEEFEGYQTSEKKDEQLTSGRRN